jgi:hypothetical protein
MEIAANWRKSLEETLFPRKESLADGRKQFTKGRIGKLQLQRFGHALEGAVLKSEDPMPVRLKDFCVWKADAVLPCNSANPRGVEHLEDAVVSEAASVKWMPAECFIIRISESRRQAAVDGNDSGPRTPVGPGLITANRVEQQKRKMFVLEYVRPPFFRARCNTKAKGNYGVLFRHGDSLVR